MMGGTSSGSAREVRALAEVAYWSGQAEASALNIPWPLPERRGTSPEWRRPSLANPDERQGKNEGKAVKSTLARQRVCGGAVGHPAPSRNVARPSTRMKGTDMPADRRTAKFIGRLISDPRLREEFEDHPDLVLKREEVKLSAPDRAKLDKLALELGQKLKPGGTNALHCEVASSVGYA